MHIEPPRVSLHSVREFLSHYLMIVLSILTALGLEAFLEHRHHVEAAETAQHAIEAELRDNLRQIEAMKHENAVRLAPLQALDAQLTRELQDGKPAAEISAEIAALVRANKVDLGLFYPTLRREAWDVAVANQAATWIPADALGRYASAYTQQRDAVTAASTVFLDGPRFIDAITDARVQGVEPRAFLRTVNQAIATLQAMQNRLDALRFALARAVPASEEGAASAAH
jgi:hypothetical protein